VNDPAGTYAFAYDNMGRLIGTTTTYSFLPNAPFTNSYSYDADSNRVGYTAPDGSTNTYTYDTLNRLITLANSWAGSFGFSYDSLSRRTQMTRPNGIATNYTYDSLSRLLSVLHQAGGSTIDGDVYTLDAAGNRTAKQDDLAGVTSNYTYDKIYELTQVTQGNNTTESYSYDPVGNRTASLAIPAYTVNSSNELTGTSNASYTYDNNGNATSKTNSSGTTNYTWDFDNFLASVTLPGTGGTVTFKYDPFGRRIQKAFTQNGTTTTTNYVYDGDNMAEMTDQNGNLVAKYVQGSAVDEPLAESTSGGTDYYEQDGLGSVTSLTSATGSIAQTYTYDSFGNTTNSSGNVTNPFRYTGRDFDSETSLYYYRARYYDPTAGRFINEDPMRFSAGTDFYLYVQNNAVNLVDPFGTCKKSPLSPQCTAARAALASVGRQLSSEGNGLTWAGIAMVGISGVGALIAPEGFPAEAGGAEAGTNLIELGGAISTLGAGLEGYGNGGLPEGIKETAVSVAVDQISSRLTGGLFPGIDSATKSAVAALLGDIPDPLKSEEVACGDN
jgi:RHS repeat-associated protein